MFKQGDIIENQLGNIFAVEDIGERFYTLSEYGKKSILSVLTIEYVNEMFKLKSNEEEELILEKIDDGESEFRFYRYGNYVFVENSKNENLITKEEAIKLYKMLEKTYNF